MKKRIIILVASWLMVFATMLMIYNFSEEDAKASSETSGSVVEDVLDVFLPSEDITDELVKKYQFPFRKLAHFGIFMLLGFCFANAYRNTIKLKQIYIYTLSFFSVIIYASLDEIHQGFTAGRGPAFKDVLIDSSGGLVGIGLFAVMMLIFYSYSKRKIRH